MELGLIVGINWYFGWELYYIAKLCKGILKEEQ